MGARRAICVALMLSVVACAVFGLVYIGAPYVRLSGVLRESVLEWGWLTVANVVVIQMTGLSCALMTYREWAGETDAARAMSRIAVGLVCCTFLLSLLINGLTWFLVIYVAQAILVVSYQVTSDPYLGEDVEVTGLVGRVVRVVTRQEYDPAASGVARGGYMRLNVFNLFWVFVVASVVGLVVEDLWQLVVFSRTMSRAGLVWGPFSPIYGFGAVLLTLVLNRVWNKGVVRLFLVGATMGAFFEFWVSWFLEHAFGVVAWDYSGTFLNIDGRTNFFFWCAWGLLSLLWMRVLLPVTMLGVDAIPLRFRAAVTCVAFAAMVFDQAVTMVALDCWSRRSSGVAYDGAIEEVVGAAFTDEFMEARFETMDFDYEETVHEKI